MAWTDFYMQTTGNNLNAGSTNADAAVATSTNGSWDVTANRFIAASGTPFTGVTVGMYASIYLDAATSAVFVSKITVVDAGGTYIEVSKTANKIGTAPSSGATGRSCKVGGAWNGVTTIANSLFIGSTVDQPTRVNIKAGSYSITAATVINLSGVTASMVWWRGYNTNIGDLDDYSSLTKPAWTCTGTGRLQWTGNFNIISGLDITAAVANDTVKLPGGHQEVHRCRITNTTANSAASAVSSSGGSCIISCCTLSATSTATAVVNTAGFVTSLWIFGTVISGGGHGVQSSGAGLVLVVGSCKFLSNGGDGINFPSITTGQVTVDRCTFYGSGSDGIEFSSVPTGLVQVTNCNFWSIGAYGINSSAGTTGVVFRAGNDFYNCTSGAENGMGDSPGDPGTSGQKWGSQTESSQPYTSSTNMTPVPSALGRAMALPRTFEYESYSTYGDVGAVQSRTVGPLGAQLIVGAGDGFIE